MKIVYKHLLSYLHQKPTIDEVSEKLFQLGHEHSIENDILDLELTPNRGDCFSVYGIARDLGVFFDFNENLNIFDETIDELNIDFENKSLDFCPNISFLEIEVEDLPEKYNDNLSSYFQCLGIKKNNFFTDISNYISYELGQPTHCFDRKEINRKLSLEMKDCNESFTTLLNTKIDLNGNCGVFSLEKEIISMAGIMGGLKTACARDTKHVLVECAYFKPELIIGKSVKYNINSEASHKFERGVDPTVHEKVLRRFIQIIKEHVPIRKLKLVSFGETPKQKVIEFDYSKINSILGSNISEREIIDKLNKLGFLIDKSLHIPQHRHDISSQNDIAEEIARVIGYDNLPSTPLNIKPIVENHERSEYSALRAVLLKNNFSEVINFPFVSQDDKDTIELDNPLDSNKRFMRQNLKDSLIENLLYNEKRQKDSIKLFEFSKVYSYDRDLNETYKIGIIASGRKGHNYRDFSKKIDKSYIAEILSEHIDINKIDEISRNNLNSKIKDKIFYFEAKIEEIINFEKKDIVSKITDNHFPKYEEISEYPSSSRDISFLIQNKKAEYKVLEELEKLNERNLKESFIFDYFFNKNTGTLKLGCRFIFQSKNRTLQENDVNQSMDRILKSFLIINGVSVPGME